MDKKIKRCAFCDKELKGCPCSWSKTSDNYYEDGKRRPRLTCGKKCLKAYEDRKQHNVPTCACCGVPFKEPAYFKGMDGKDVHFKCQETYDRELLKK
tara:strand:+ start:3294 stop:3584 length:291 start_codon:yes stop_codon:yes gene_type:complete